RSQFHRASLLSQFDYVIRYRKGTLNGQADALSRKPEHHITSETTYPPLLRSDQIQISSFELATLIAASHIEPTILQTVRDAARVDPEYQRLQRTVAGDATVDKHLSLDNELLWYKGRLYIPDKRNVRLHILEQDHDSKVAEH